MFRFLGFAALAIGLVGALLFYSGIGASVPGFSSIPVNGYGYLVVTAVGAIVAMIGRQTAD
jgi:hypothetical protein